MDTVRFEAAGGVVVHDGCVLVLRSVRYSDLRLPKGHIEAGESSREAALREVAEESGYVDLEIVADLGEQVVAYDVGDRHTIRDEHYYLMRLQSVQQTPREMADLKFTPEWLSWDQAIGGLTFDEERCWLIKARAILEEQS